jgi:hypothetical protein
MNLVASFVLLQELAGGCSLGMPRQQIIGYASVTFQMRKLDSVCARHESDRDNR